MTEATVHLTIPADSRYIALARLTTASLAAEFGFSIDEIDDLRMAATELVSFLGEQLVERDRGELQLTFTVDSDLLRLEALSADEPSGPTVVDTLTRQILEAVVNEHDLTSRGGFVLKRRATG